MAVPGRPASEAARLISLHPAERTLNRAPQVGGRTASPY